MPKARALLAPPRRRIVAPRHSPGIPPVVEKLLADRGATLLPGTRPDILRRGALLSRPARLAPALRRPGGLLPQAAGAVERTEVHGRWRQWRRRPGSAGRGGGVDVGGIRARAARHS
jgi:hypothetical protein